MQNFIDELKNYLENLTEEQREELREQLSGPEIPSGWISIDEHLPMFRAMDIVQGYSEYKVKLIDGTEQISCVADHDIWFYEAKELGVTHWWNE